MLSGHRSSLAGSGGLRSKVRPRDVATFLLRIAKQSLTSVSTEAFHDGTRVYQFSRLQTTIELKESKKIICFNRFREAKEQEEKRDAARDVRTKLLFHRSPSFNGVHRRQKAAEIFHAVPPESPRVLRKMFFTAQRVD